MSHATDSLLQAYHDGELDSPAQAELRAHLAACAQCAQQLDELRRTHERFTGAVALLDVPAPTLKTRAALAAAARAPTRSVGVRRLAAGSLARAAMLLLALAGVVTAIPGTPLRRALEAVLDRFNAGTPRPEVLAPPAVEEPALPANEVTIAPADSRVRVLVHGATAVDVTVTLVDDEKASVQTLAPGHDVRFRSATGRLEISGLARGTMRIKVPRAVANATVEIDGQVYVYKQDGLLQLSGPAGSSRGEEVSFRIGG